LTRQSLDLIFANSLIQMNEAEFDPYPSDIGDAC